uniref:Uncharacterized protein n=1 Tax=Cyanistes caeruleus TaxID=156563 RepID=A0A8C0U929_CYACU
MGKFPVFPPPPPTFPGFWGFWGFLLPKIPIFPLFPGKVWAQSRIFPHPPLAFPWDFSPLEKFPIFPRGKFGEFFGNFSKLPNFSRFFFPFFPRVLLQKFPGFSVLPFQAENSRIFPGFFPFFPLNSPFPGWKIPVFFVFSRNLRIWLPGSTAWISRGASALFDMIEYYESATHLNIGSNKHLGPRGWQAAAHMMRKVRIPGKHSQNSQDFH